MPCNLKNVIFFLPITYYSKHLLYFNLFYWTIVSYNRVKYIKWKNSKVHCRRNGFLLLSFATLLGKLTNAFWIFLISRVYQLEKKKTMKCLLFLDRWSVVFQIPNLALKRVKLKQVSTILDIVIKLFSKHWNNSFITAMRIICWCHHFYYSI